MMKFQTGDWRWLLCVLIAAYALLTLGGVAMKLAPEKLLLQGLGVAALDHPFMDLRGVAAWCDAAKEGKDPALVETSINLPGSPNCYTNFLMNYAPTVLALGTLGLTQESASAWSLGLILLYVVSLFMLVKSCSIRGGVFWSLLICSPCSVLAMERGNLDLLLFAMLVVALLLRKHPWIGTLMILGAASLKFFPIAGLLAPWREGGRNARTATLVACALFLVFLGLLHTHLAAIGGSLSAQYQTAFGCTTIVDLFAHNGMLSGANIGYSHLLLKLISVIGLGITFFAGFWISFRNPIASPITERAGYAFFLTAPMLLGLFFLGPQMDYKWIFFLFMVPALQELAKSDSISIAGFAKCSLVSVILYSYWTFFSDEGSLRNALLKQILMWLIVLLSAFFAGFLWRRKNAA